MSAMPGQNKLVRMIKCKQCGSIFPVICSIEEYGWRIPLKSKKLYFCSYSCMRKYEKPRLQKIEKRAEMAFREAEKCTEHGIGRLG